MKKRLRLTPILIAIMMLFTMMPLISAPAHAEEIYKLWINGKRVMAGATSGDGWEFDASSNTLTLTDATITKGRSENENYGIYYQGSKGLNIVLEGSNSIESADEGTDLTRGIYSTSGDITISGDGSLSIDVNADGIYAGQDVFIKGGSITSSGATAIQAGRNVEIEGGTVTATSTLGNAIYATYLIELKGGSVTASGTGTGSGIYADGGINEISKNVRIWAGDDESSATDVTDEFKTKFAQYKWVHASTCTLWVGGIPVTSRNAENILGDAGASASYDADTETLTLDNYNFENEGHRFGALNNFYAAIYADQDLTIQLVGNSTVMCKEQESSVGFGIYSTNKDLTISGSGTLNATGYGQGGIGIQTSNADITINGGTVTASGDNGLSANGGSIIINDGIVTAIGSSSDLGISADDILVADKMGINAGDSKETAIAVDKKEFETNHPQQWVQVSEAYPLWVRGIWVMASNKDDVLGNGKVSFEPNANTLKLNGATITAGDKDSNGIKYSGSTPLNIESKSGSVNKVNGVNNCIYSSDGGQLVFSGKGTLNVTASGSNGIGIKSDAGIVIKDGSKLTAKGKAKAIHGTVKNYITGTGWTDYEGKATAVQIKKSTGGAKLTKYKKVQFPEKVSGTPTAKMQAGKTSVTISWNNINGAEGYDIFFARCDHHGKKIACKNVKNIKGNKTFKWTKSGLKNGTAYKAYVKAYIYKNGKKTYVRTSPMMHAYTGNGTKIYTNAKSVTLKNVKKGKLSLKKGKTFKIKAKVNKIQKSKKLMPKSHAPTLRYISSNKKVATVTKSGKITAKGIGTCTITVFAHNGASKNIKVTVK